MSQFSKKTLQYLTDLARLEVTRDKEEKLLKDLQKILGYFEQLKEVNTENIEPMAGGTTRKNVFREDESEENGIKREIRDKLIEAFPEKENNYLKIPSVFE